MAIEDIVYPDKLEVRRLYTTWIARRAIANWSNYGWRDFEASSDLPKMNPDLARLKDLLAEVFTTQKGFSAFDVDLFNAAWKKWTRDSSLVQVAYNAVWDGFPPGSRVVP